MVLFIDACARKGSRSRELAEAVLLKVTEKDPEVERVSLYDEGLKPLTEDMINKRDAALRKGDFSDPFFDKARQFAAADSIVMAVPYWDLSFPAVLKLYIETVCVNGVSFRYDEGRPVGLCRAKKLYYVTTSGGEIGDFNFGYDYVKALSMGLLGIEDTVCIRAVGLDMITVDAGKVLENAKSRIADYQIDTENN